MPEIDTIVVDITPYHQREAYRARVRFWLSTTLPEATVYVQVQVYVLERIGISRHRLSNDSWDSLLAVVDRACQTAGLRAGLDPDDIDDIVQEAIVALWKKLCDSGLPPPLLEDSPLHAIAFWGEREVKKRGWLRPIRAFVRIHADLRSRLFREDTAAREPEEHTPSGMDVFPESALIAKDLVEKLRALLSPTERQLFDVLLEHEALGHSPRHAVGRAAQLLGLSQPTVRRLLAEIRSFIQAFLHAAENGERFDRSLALHVYAPRSMQATAANAMSVVVRAFLARNTANERDEVARRATSMGISRLHAEASGAHVKSGTHLSIQLLCEGASVSPAEQTVIWTGRITAVSFRVRMTQLPVQKTLECAVVVAHAGIPLLWAHFDIQTGPRVHENADVEYRRLESAFISYSRKDEVEVLRMIRGLLLAGVDLFYDRLSIEAAQNWKQRIHSEVESREALVLCWSINAKRSRWVDYEWKLAQRLHRRILPSAVPNRAVPQLPNPLRHLHLSDPAHELLKGVGSQA